MYAIESAFGQRLFNRLVPWQTDDLARFCDSLGAMWDKLLELTEETGSDGEPGYVPGYGKIFDVDECPTAFLPYLGRFVGVPVPVGASDAEARALIRAEAGQSRGTPGAIESAIKRSIAHPWQPDTAYIKEQLVSHEASPGDVVYYEATANFTSGVTFETTHLTVISIDSQFEVLEREKPGGEEAAWHLTVLVHPQQLTPVGDPAELEANINATKPAGIVLHIVETEQPLSTDPLIDEGTLAIDEVGEATIENATLADIT